MEEYYNCKYVCLSRARSFGKTFCLGKNTPTPTCSRFNRITDNDALRGTYETCEYVALSGRCLIPGAEEAEIQRKNLKINKDR